MKGIIVKLAFVIALTTVGQVTFMKAIGWLAIPAFLNATSYSSDRLVWRMALTGMTDAIYFGDSTNVTVDNNDIDKRPISDLLAERIPACKIGSISHPAYEATIYLEFAGHIARQNDRPHVLIFPINLRSFSPEWDARPEYQFEREKLLLRGGLPEFVAFYFWGPLDVLCCTPRQINREQQFLDTPVYDEAKRVGTVKDYIGEAFARVTSDNMRRKLVLNYMSLIDANHRKIRAFRDLVDVLHASGIHPLLYVTPIDVETGEAFLPDRFRRRIEANTQAIRRVLETADIIDMSVDLPAAYFARNQDLYPNEHLAERGRRYVAKKLADRLQSILMPTGNPGSAIRTANPRYQ